jgi:prepilin-type N-terminal cleavage/methylation domain-containing protein
MLARIRKAQQEKEGGFTLIELLVVMIIIGILAAIAIPVFLSQRAKAQDSAAKSDVSTIGKEIATYYVDGTGTGVLSKTTAAVAAVAGTSDAIPVGHYMLVAGGYSYNLGKASANVTVTAGAATNITEAAWCVGVQNNKGDKKNWVYSSAGGLEQGTCTNTART